MTRIGITGGIGAGKSEVSAYIAKNYKARVILADEVAHLLKKKGQCCYKPLIQLLGSDILLEDGEISKEKMAAKIFGNPDLLTKVNALLHPAVKAYIAEQIAGEYAAKELDFLLIEAALLIEAQYDEIVDELWYVYADEEIRKNRLHTARGYSEEKIANIMKAQLREEEFRAHAQTVIDNSAGFAKTYLQIDKKMRTYLCKKK